MMRGKDPPPDEAIELAIQGVGLPALRDLHAKGRVQVPQRYETFDEYLDAMARLFRRQAALLREEVPRDEKGRRAARALTYFLKGTGLTRNELYQLFDSIPDWSELGDDIWLRSSPGGSVSLEGCALVLTTAVRETRGANVFATRSPAYPTPALEALEQQGVATEKLAPMKARGDESTAYLLVVAPRWSIVRRAKPLPEDTWFNFEAYHPKVRDFVKEMLHERLGKYEPSTRVIVRDRMLGSLLTAIKGYRGDGHALPVYGGRLAHGERGLKSKFAGGDLELIRFVENLGGDPFFQLPQLLSLKPARRRARHQVVAQGPFRLDGPNCSFLFENDVDLPADMVVEAATGALSDDPRVRHPGIFRPLAPTVVELAGADSEVIEYLYADAFVGRPGSRRDKRMHIRMLMRGVNARLTHGWGVRGRDLTDELVQREVVQEAERQVAMLKPGGIVDETVRYLQDRGVQTAGNELPARRTQREGLILCTDALMLHADLGSSPSARGAAPQKPSA